MTGFRGILRGAAAGAAGTTALNAVTYLDMAVRARPASETPQQAVDAIARKAGHPVPGAGAEKENRLAGLGPLTGIATGITVGMFVGVCRPALGRLAAPIVASAIGVAAMALTDGSLVSLGLSDPVKWSRAEWVSDLVPHLAYGAVTYAALQAVAT